MIASFRDKATEALGIIIRARRAISPETAQLFAAALGTSAQFWMNAQASYDLATHRIQVHVEPLLAVV